MEITDNKLVDDLKNDRKDNLIVPDFNIENLKEYFLQTKKTQYEEDQKHIEQFNMEFYLQDVFTDIKEKIKQSFFSSDYSLEKTFKCELAIPYSREHCTKYFPDEKERKYALDSTRYQKKLLNIIRSNLSNRGFTISNSQPIGIFTELTEKLSITWKFK